MYFAAIILQMDLALSKFMSNLKRPAARRKLESFEGIGKEKAITPVEVIPTTSPIPPAASRKRGRPPKVQAGPETGQSSIRQSSMLSPSMQVAQAVQFEFLPEDEGVLVAIPTRNLIEELVELQSRATVVGKTLGEELNMTSA